MNTISDSSAVSGTARQVSAIMAGKIIALIATFAMPLFLTRFLSKSEFGLFSQFYVLVNFLTVLFSLGIQSNLYYFFPKVKPEEQKSLVIHTLLFLMCFTAVAIGLVNIPWLGRLIIGKSELINYVAFISLGILFLLPVIIIEPLYVAKTDNLTSIFYPPAVVLSRLFLVIGFAVTWHSLRSVMSGIIASALICFVFVVWYTLKGIRVADFGRLIIPRLAIEQFKYSWPFGLALVLNTLALQFDKIICISFLTPAAFATYAIAFYGIPGVEQVYQSLSQVYLIKMTQKHHENKPAEISEIYKSLVTKTYSFSVPAIVLVSLYAKRIIILFFTDKYLDAIPLFRIYILSFLVFMLGAGLILRATDRTLLSLKAYFFSSLVTLPLTYFLIKNYGIWGGISCAMISIILPKALQLRYEMQLVGSTVLTYFPWKKFAKIAAISLIAISPFAVIEFLFDYPNVWIAFFGTFYLALVSIIEMKYNVFVFDSLKISNLYKTIAARSPFPVKYSSR